MSDKRALVTGLSGFTGEYLARDLERNGYTVLGLDDPALAYPHSHQTDLLDKAALTRIIDETQPTVVVHLAAISFVGHGNAEDFYRVNIIGTRNLLETLAKTRTPPECVLLASSANIYGNAFTANGLIDENVAPNPANDYAVSKLAMEYMASLWTDRLPIVLTRPFNYTGAGQSTRFLIPKIVEHFKRGEKTIELGNIDVERDFSDVRFVTEAYVRLLRTVPAGQKVNICSGNAWSLRRILAMMAEIAGYEIDVQVNPLLVRTNEVKRLLGNPRKLESLVGDLRQIPLRETLRWMYSGSAS